MRDENTTVAAAPLLPDCARQVVITSYVGANQPRHRVRAMPVRQVGRAMARSSDAAGSGVVDGGRTNPVRCTQVPYGRWRAVAIRRTAAVLSAAGARLCGGRPDGGARLAECSGGVAGLERGGKRLRQIRDGGERLIERITVVADLHEQALVGNVLVIAPRLNADGACKAAVHSGEICGHRFGQRIISFKIRHLVKAGPGRALPGPHDEHHARDLFAVELQVVRDGRIRVAVGIPVHVDEHAQRRILFLIGAHGFLRTAVCARKLRRLMVGGIVQNAKAVRPKLFGQQLAHRDNVLLVVRGSPAPARRIGVGLRLGVRFGRMRVIDQDCGGAPIVGTEQQSEALVQSLLATFEQEPGAIWQTNLFGKSLYDLVRDGMAGKGAMPPAVQQRIQSTLQRIVNEGCNGLICIML